MLQQRPVGGPSVPGQDRMSNTGSGIDLGSRYASQLGFESLKPYEAAASAPTPAPAAAPSSPKSKKKKKKKRKKKENQATEAKVEDSGDGSDDGEEEFDV